MGKGGGQQPTESTVTQTNIPEYAQPYFEDILNRAGAWSNNEYTPYGGPRIAGFNQNQTNTQNQIMGMTQPGQFGTATNLASQAGLASLNAGQYNPASFDYQNVNASNLNQYQMDPAQMFGQAQVDQYTSPFQQNVTDITKREAITDAQKSQLTHNLDAARTGSYGGARQLLATTERERNLNQNLSDIQAKGLQNAYENAQQQFERDRTAGFNVGRENLNANLGVQQLGAQTGLQAALANQAADMDAQRASEQSNQFGATLGMQGAAQANQSAQTLGQLGTASQQATLDRLQAQSGVGDVQHAQSQSYLDQMYADFLRQRDYPMEQLSYFSNILHGLPVGLNSTQTTYAQQPSAASQLGGLGLGGLSLYNLLK